MPNFFDSLKQIGESVFASSVEMRYLKERQVEDRATIKRLDDDLRKLAQELSAVRERLGRVEANRDADRAQFASERAQLVAERMQVVAERAELSSHESRFKYEVEAALMRINAARCLPQITATENEPTP